MNKLPLIKKGEEMNERSVSDTEFIESLKSLIDAYFQTKMRTMGFTQQVESAPMDDGETDREQALREQALKIMTDGGLW